MVTHGLKATNRKVTYMSSKDRDDLYNSVKRFFEDVSEGKIKDERLLDIAQEHRKVWLTGIPKKSVDKSGNKK